MISEINRRCEWFKALQKTGNFNLIRVRRKAYCSSFVKCSLFLNMMSLVEHKSQTAQQNVTKIRAMMIF
jgi:hypothetical protein